MTATTRRLNAWLLAEGDVQGNRPADASRTLAATTALNKASEALPPIEAGRSNDSALLAARQRILAARAGLNPVVRSHSRPGLHYSLGDGQRPVITGRMGEVCELLDRLAEREARQHS
jgi:hypothetical protein